MVDRIGIGWRADLAAGILARLDRIDVVEVIADDWLDASRREQRALRTLAAQVPVTLHGVGLGMASAVPVDGNRLDRLARLIDVVRPARWSEHLAFVRGGGLEIGHLAAPPRTLATVEGTARNIARAARIVGTRPEVENVATLIDPPASDRDENTWIREILDASGADLLLDLHNLHANAVNFGFDARQFLERLPTARIASVHVAGGRWVRTPAGGRRLLDDHRHEVPPEVYALLIEVAASVPRALDVILERDGRYPSMDTLLSELDRARAALAEGRRRRGREAA